MYRNDDKLQYDVVIPMYRPDVTFEELIYRILKQSRRPKQIILINTEVEPEFTTIKMKERIQQWVAEFRIPGSGDTTIRLEGIKKDEFDHGGTRHLATKLCTEENVLFMTQDALPKDRFMAEELLRVTEAPEAAVAYARQLPKPGASAKERLIKQFNYPEESRWKTKADFDELGIKTFFCSNVCAMYNMRIYRMLGGFERKTIFNEDMIYAAKAIDAGFSVVYCAKARVIHSHDYSYPEEFRRNFDLGVSQSQNAGYFHTVSSEKEGVRLVKQTIQKLAEKKEYIDIADFLAQSAAKFIGYTAGKNYQQIPEQFRKYFSMNRGYWEGL